jgi:hypothetical protein
MAPRARPALLTRHFVRAVQSLTHAWYDQIMEETIVAPTSNLDPDEDFEAIFSPKPRENPVYIDDLEDAVEFDLTARIAWFKPKPGEQVVIERWFEGRWLGTGLYTVRSVDVKTGDLMLHDDNNQQSAMANFITGTLKHRWRFKLPIKGLNLNKREAPKQPTRAVQEPSKPQVDESDQPLPKRIGRPKGSKNRSPEQIRADEAAKAREKAEKKAHRRSAEA